jgi:two-component system, NtrC family, sensor kinase
MKKALVFLLALFCAFEASAQDAEIRKLQRQLRDHPQADTSRVNRLNQLSLLSVSPGMVDTLSAEALAISQKTSYEIGRGYALIGRAKVILLKGDKAGSVAISQQAAEIARKNGDQVLLTYALMNLARAKQQTTENKQALAYALQAEASAQKTGNKILLAICQRSIASFYENSLSDHPRAMEWILRSEKTAEEANSLNDLAQAWSELAALYTALGDQASSLVYYKKAFEANKKIGNSALQSNLLNHIGERYRLLGKYPEALKAYQQGLTGVTAPYTIELNESNMADVYVRMNNLPMAFKYAFKSLHSAQKIGDIEGTAWIYGILGRAYLKLGKPDSALYYAKQGLFAAVQTGTLEFMRDNSGVLTGAYAATGDFSNAYKYHTLYISYRDSMNNAEVSNRATLLTYNYDLAKKQAQITALNQEKKMQYYFLLGSLGVLTLIATIGIILFKSNRQKHKANILLSKQKQLIEEQRDQTNKALNELQLTQRQLVQREKMASLGELTAGIAHEIQNPLNFVNNFSEVTVELSGDLKEEIKAGNSQEALAIAGDIEQNLKKIHHHGQRADFIVKGMLQHSRSSTGERQLTDINVLADEFFKLSYHGLRAKDKAFNAEMVTDFDQSLPKINVVPQDMGRVLLNLFNNAFYAVNQKKKTAGASYKPEVMVNTLRENGYIVVRVKDNGNGIPENIKDKIMQPFFTTKPAGEGTGLGLSLSYDIIVKEHGGKIDVITKDGEYTEFIVTLP